MASLLVGILIVAALASASTTAQATTVGGYADVSIGVNETALLTTALANDALYGATVTPRVCFTTITSLQQQTVAGTNSKYSATVCDVSSAQGGQGKCPSDVVASCAPREVVVTVFEQPWTNTIQVSSIVSASDNSSSSSGASGNRADVVSNAPSSNVPTPAPTTKSGATGVATITNTSGVAVAAIALLSAFL